MGWTLVLSVGCDQVVEPVVDAWHRATGDAVATEVEEAPEPEPGSVSPGSTVPRLLHASSSVPRRADSVAEADAAPLLPGSRRVTEPTLVYAEPRPEAVALGLVAAGTKLGVFGRVDGEGCEESGGWWAVAPRGYVCAPTEARAAAPTQTLLPHVPTRATTPGVYGKVREGAAIYASRADAEAGHNASRPDGSLTVQRMRAEKVGGRSFWRTQSGWIAAADIRRHRPSSFAGVSLRDGEHQLPLGWTLARADADRATVPVYAEPRRRAKVVDRLAPRTLVSVGETTDGFISTPQGWIDARDLRIARETATPTTHEGDERWIDLDLDAQVLVAYEGTTPSYATLVSSGRVLHRTPTGVFRIERKIAERTMNSMADSDETYRVAKVPWTAYFAKGYALHAAYWHGGFGRPRSHGCVNLSPRDARALYDWTGPLAAPGWSEVYGHAEQPGSLIRIRSRRDPDPQVQGYARQWLPSADDAADDEPAGDVVVASTARWATPTG